MTGGTGGTGRTGGTRCKGPSDGTGGRKPPDRTGAPAVYAGPPRDPVPHRRRAAGALATRPGPARAPGRGGTPPPHRRTTAGYRGRPTAEKTAAPNFSPTHPTFRRVGASRLRAAVFRPGVRRRTVDPPGPDRSGPAHASRRTGPGPTGPERPALIGQSGEGHSPALATPARPAPPHPRDRRPAGDPRGDLRHRPWGRRVRPASVVPHQERPHGP